MVSSNTSVNNSQVNEVFQAINLDGCTVNVSDDFDAYAVSTNSATANQVTSSSQSTALNNSIAASLSQANTNASGGGLMNFGVQDATNSTNIVMGISNSIANDVFVTSAAYNSSVQSFNCNDSVINAKNLVISLGTSNEFLGEQTTQNSQVSDVTNSLSADMDQSNKNIQTGSIILILLLLGFLVGLLIFVCTIFKEDDTQKNGTSDSPMTTVAMSLKPLFLGAFGALVVLCLYGFNIYPFTDMAQCSLSSSSGGDGCSDCVSDKNFFATSNPNIGWADFSGSSTEHLIESIPGFAKSVEMAGPQRYFYPITKLDQEPPNAASTMSAANQNLVMMAIQSRNLNGGDVSSNFGMNLANRDLFRDTSTGVNWSASFTIHGSDYYNSDTLPEGSTFQAKGSYVMTAGQIISGAMINELSFSRNAGVSPTTPNPSRIYSPIYDSNGNIATPESKNVTLWSLARVALPLPELMYAPGACCSATSPTASYVKIARSYIGDTQSGATGNVYNCCTPSTISVADDEGGLDINMTAVSVVAGEDHCYSASGIYTTATYDHGLFFDGEYSALVCQSSNASAASQGQSATASDVTAASSACGSSSELQPRAFCDCADRTAGGGDSSGGSGNGSSGSSSEPVCSSTDGTDECNASGMAGYCTVDGAHSQAGFTIADISFTDPKLVLAKDNTGEIIRYMNVDSPYAAVGDYARGRGATWAECVNIERALRGRYARFVLCEILGIDTSVAADFREIVKIYNTTEATYQYGAIGDFLDGSSAVSECNGKPVSSNIPGSSSDGATVDASCYCNDIDGSCNAWGSVAYSNACYNTTYPYCANVPNKTNTASGISISDMNLDDIQMPDRHTSSCGNYTTQTACEEGDTSTGAGNLCAWRNPTNAATSGYEKMEKTIIGNTDVRLSYLPGVCSLVYAIKGLPTSVEQQSIDGFGRNGITSDKDHPPTYYGLFGKCNSPAYSSRIKFLWVFIISACIIILMVVVSLIVNRRKLGGRTSIDADSGKKIEVVGEETSNS